MTVNSLIKKINDSVATTINYIENLKIRLATAEKKLEEIRVARNEELQNAFKAGYVKAMQDTSGGTMETKEEDQKLVLNKN